MRFFITLVAAAILLAACGADTAPLVITDVPTTTQVIALPTAPPQQAEIVSILATSTPPPTSTRPPTVSGSGPLATSPLHPTFTNLPPTATSTNAPTEVGIAIDYFTTISQEIIPGDTITLAWRVLGGATEIIIYRIGTSGQNERQWAVQREGQINVSTNPARTDAAEFVLVAQSGNQLIEQRLLIEINCSQTWFFDPSPETCANQAPEPSLQVEQIFEGGRMIWVANNSQIYVFFADEQQPRWLQIADTFEEGQQERDDSLVPPEGRFQPVRGFGIIWRNNTNIRDRLGWATEPESAYEGMLQANAANTTVYMRTRDGGIIGYQSGGRNWEFIPPPGATQ